MSEIGDDFKALREISRRKKEHNQISSENILINKGIKFIKFTEYHLRLEDYSFDFYPPTGIYINMKTKKQGRGVFNLLKELK